MLTFVGPRYIDARKDLWNEIVSFSIGRIKSYIHELQKNLNELVRHYKPKHDGTCDRDSLLHSMQAVSLEAPSPVSFEQIRTICQACKLQSLQDVLQPLSVRDTDLVEVSDGLLRMLNFAYTLRYDSSIKSLFDESVQQTALTGRILRDIIFLGRFGAAYATFLHVIEEFPHFGNVKILPNNPVKPPKPFRQAKNTVLSLKETLRLMNLELTRATILHYLGPKKTVEEVDAAFKSSQSDALYTHAEVQIAILLAQRNHQVEKVFPYIGCSKLCCFLCHEFTQSLGLRLRESHHRIFAKWTVPYTLPLRGQDLNTFKNTISRVRNSVVRQILAPTVRVQNMRATSIADVTSVGSAADAQFRREALTKPWVSTHLEQGDRAFHGRSTTQSFQR